jgi:hypothetical protein
MIQYGQTGKQEILFYFIQTAQLMIYTGTTIYGMGVAT